MGAFDWLAYLVGNTPGGGPTPNDPTNWPSPDVQPIPMPNPTTLPGGPSGGPAPSNTTYTPGSVLNAGMNIFGQVNKAVEQAAPIANLFRTTPTNQDKATATNLQQNIEKTALSIQQMVNSGQIRPEAGMAALDSLERQGVQMGIINGAGGTNTSFASGGQHAELIVSQVKADIQSRVMNNNDAFVNAPMKGAAPNPNAFPTPDASGGMTPGGGTLPGGPSDSAGPSGGSRVAPVTGANEPLQNLRLRTGLRNYLTGADDSLKGTMLTSPTAPVSPFDFIDQAMSGAQKATPQFKTPPPIPNPYAKTGGARY